MLALCQTWPGEKAGNVQNWVLGGAVPVGRHVLTKHILAAACMPACL